MRRILISLASCLPLLGTIAAPASAEECLWCREYLTGDLWGARSGLAEHSVVADLQLTQFYQNVATGGADEADAYGGKLDYFLTFAKGAVVLHGETRFGEDVILDAAGVAPVNANMLYPSLENTTAITGLQFNLPLTSDQQWIATAGKVNTLDLFQQIYPQTGRGVDGFMNASVFLPLGVVRTIPLSFLGAGVLKMKGKQVQGGLMVYDSHNVPTSSGFDELFDNGANILAAYRIFTDFGGLPGSHLFMGTWATGSFTPLDRTGWSFLPGVGIVAPESNSSWSYTYILEQKLWVDPCSGTRDIGLLSQWSIADPETSPFAWSGNVSVQATGLIDYRPRDTMGVGYFYTGLSGDVKDLFPRALPLRDAQGAELYYNAAVTRWFNVTADLQIVQPADERNDTAVVVGLRAKIDL